MLCLCSWYSSLHIIRLLMPCSNYFAMKFNWTLKWNSVTMGLLHLALERFNLCYFFLQLCYLQWIVRKKLSYTDNLSGLSTFMLQLDSHSFYYLSWLKDGCATAKSHSEGISRISKLQSSGFCLQFKSFALSR